MDRSAPAEGYDFGTKKHYRRQVWRFFSDNCPVPRAHAQALLMPSIEGSEIEVALQRGFREQNLHVVDRNPAIVAVLKRRYPRINTYGIDVARIPERIQSGVIHVANLDLCSTITKRWVETCCTIAKHLAIDGLIAATYKRGRDSVIFSATRVSEAYDENGDSLLDDNGDLLPGSDLLSEAAGGRARMVRSLLCLQPDVNALIEWGRKERGYDENKLEILRKISDVFPVREETYQSTSPMGWVAGRSMYTPSSWLRREAADFFLDYYSASMLKYIDDMKHVLQKQGIKTPGW